MIDNPKISVIMSVYNGQKYLKHSIESILNQTFKDFEFIIINDYSIDNTQKIIESYKDQRIILINNRKNLGLPKSLNIGLNKSSGKYIARMDADDISLPHRLEAQYNFLEKNKQIGLIGGQVEKIDSSNNSIGYKKSRPQDLDIIKFWIITKNPLVHPTIFFRKEILKIIGPYNETFIYAQDFELYSRIIKKYKITNLPEVLIKFRYHNESITRTSLKRKIQLEYALSIIHKNINNYIKLNKKDTDTFINTINNKDVNLTHIIKSLITYKRLFKSFIKKEKLNVNQFKKIQSFYKTEQKMIIGNFLKIETPYLYKFLKYFK